MPDGVSHIRQAEHNERLYIHLTTLGTVYRDWQTTTLFYAALHYVDAWLAGPAVLPQGLHPRSHETRQETVFLFLRSIHEDYRKLEYASRDARYNNRIPASVGQLHANEFTRIRTFVRSALSLPT